MQRVLLLGPDDESRRALHLLLDRRGLAVVAATELDTARKHFATADCDVVLASVELAVEACMLAAAPPVIAIVRTRDLAVSRSLFEAGIDDVITDPIDDLAITLALRHATRRAPAPRVPIVAPLALIGDDVLEVVVDVFTNELQRSGVELAETVHPKGETTMSAKKSA